MLGSCISYFPWSSVLMPVVWAFFLAPADVKDTPYLIARDRDVCFRNLGYTSTGYVYFRKDGTYRRLRREHMGVFEYDRGTWKQDRDGSIELSSSMRVKNLLSSPLKVPARHVTDLKILKRLKKDLDSFLAQTDSNSFLPAEIEGAFEYEFSPSSDDPNLKATFPAVLVDYDVQSVSRDQIRKLADAWQQYLASEDKSRFHLTAITYKMQTVIVCKDDSELFQPTVSQARKWIDTKTNVAPPPCGVYSLYDFRKFHKEAKFPHGFHFHREDVREDEPLSAIKSSASSEAEPE